MKKEMSEISLREIQLSELELLKKIDKFCKKNNIQYCIAYGTLLGAIRHKGFIPWDDDIDIVLMRKDFDKFCELIKKEKTIKFRDYKTDDNYNFYIPIVYDENIDIVNTSFVNKKIVHPWVDVFPYDNYPNNIIKRKIHVMSIMILRALINLSAFNDVVKINKKNRPFYERILISLGKKINFSKLLNTKKLLNRVEKRLKKYNKKDCKYISCLMGDEKTKEIIPKSLYDEISMYEFEDYMFPASKYYDEYLTHYYGDYMTLPSSVDRVVKHNINLTEEEENGKSKCNNTGI